MTLRNSCSYDARTHHKINKQSCNYLASHGIPHTVAQVAHLIFTCINRDWSCIGNPAIQDVMYDVSCHPTWCISDREHVSLYEYRYAGFYSVPVCMHIKGNCLIV